MSRIGYQPIELPSGVFLKTSGRDVSVKGPKGELKLTLRPEVDLDVGDKVIKVVNNRPARDGSARAFHGMTRALIQNMVIGVDKGYERKLDVNGVGYTVKLEGKKLVMNLGFSHPVSVDLPDSVEVQVPSQTSIVVSGCDKQQVGEIAAQIRKLRPPEPYKGKGIKYDFEIIKRKAGKAFGSA